MSQRPGKINEKPTVAWSKGLQLRHTTEPQTPERTAGEGVPLRNYHIKKHPCILRNSESYRQLGIVGSIFYLPSNLYEEKGHPLV